MSDPHPPSEELACLDAVVILDRLNDGTLSSEELVRGLLERGAAIDDPHSETALRSVAAYASNALEIARLRDQERGEGRLRGSLHGVPVMIKDNIEAKGLPGTAGATSLVGRPARDAVLVERLREAGAIVLASTNLSQWANMRSPRSTSGWSATGGLVANPWSLDRTAGGSSSGSGAALAAGLTPLAVGTETDGSIICPASVNGVVGLKPTVGVVPTTHVVPLSSSQDSPGPMARSVADVALLFSVLSGTVRTPAPTSFTLNIATNWYIGHPASDALVSSTIGRLRADNISCRDVELAQPGATEWADELTVLLGDLRDDLDAYLAGRPGPGPVSLADVVAHEEDHADVELPFFGHEFLVQARDAGGRATSTYRDARERNLAWATTCLEVGLHDADVLVAGAYGPAWKSDLVNGGSSGLASCVTMAPAIAGWPIMSLPIGLVGGLPVGLALVARPHDEWNLLHIAAHVERVIRATTSLPRPTWSAPGRG